MLNKTVLSLEKKISEAILVPEAVSVDQLKK